MISEILIRDILETDISQLNETVNSVISERMYLAFVELFEISSTESFVLNNMDKEYPNLVAECDGRIIGWCDVVAKSPFEFAHVGVLGMGVVNGFRGNGLGRRLIDAALDSAVRFGFEKVELDVFSSNRSAQSLYENVGFEIEGIRRRSRKIDGIYQDSVLMCKFLNWPGTTT